MNTKTIWLGIAGVDVLTVVLTPLDLLAVFVAGGLGLTARRAWK